jgi:hypothetical protein
VSIPARINIVTIGVSDVGRSAVFHEQFDWERCGGYFADPDGHPWEVCYNLDFPVDGDGRIHIP